MPALTACRRRVAAPRRLSRSEMRAVVPERSSISLAPRVAPADVTLTRPRQADPECGHEALMPVSRRTPDAPTAEVRTGNPLVSVAGAAATAAAGQTTTAPRHALSRAPMVVSA